MSVLAELIKHLLLREHCRKGDITFGQARAGEIWADDMRAGESGSKPKGAVRHGARPQGSSPRGFSMAGLNIVRGKKAASLLGKDNARFHIARAICVLNKSLAEAVEEIGMSVSEGIANLKDALSRLEDSYSPEMPENGRRRQASSTSGSATAEWQDLPGHLETQAIVRGEKPPKKVMRAVVHCFICHMEWPYGQRMPECGKARCRAPGSMTVAMREDG